MPEETRQNYLGKEFGRAGNDILTKYGGFGENPDKVISTKGMSYIKDIERDTHLASSLATRRQKLIKKGWRIVPASEKLSDVKIAEFVEWNLINMVGSFEKDMEGMLDAIGKGFSLTEINYEWVNWNGKMLVGLKNLRYKDPELFSFRFDNLGYFTLRQIDPDANGVDLPLDKFVHIVSGYDDENPYGQSIIAECSFWVWVKKNVAKFWAIYAEKFGMPLSKVTVPRNADPAELTKAQEIMDAIQEETGIRVPEGFIVEFMEATRSGEASYEKFIELCNAEISKRTQGATLIAEAGKRGSGGSYALGSEHSDLFEDIIFFDACVMEAALTEQLIKRLVRYNWDVQSYPRFEFIEFSVGIFITFSQSIYNLVQSGLKISTDWVYNILKIPKPKEGEAVLEAPKPVTASPKPGQDGNSEPSEASPKPDNKIKMAEIFADLTDDEKAIITSLDRLSERYQGLMAEKYEALAESIKKKASRQKVV